MIVVDYDLITGMRTTPLIEQQESVIGRRMQIFLFDTLKHWEKIQMFRYGNREWKNKIIRI